MSRKYSIFAPDFGKVILLSAVEATGESVRGWVQKSRV